MVLSDQTWFFMASQWKKTCNKNFFPTLWPIPLMNVIIDEDIDEH